MSNEKSDSTLQFNLLDNGVDFILKGIDELFDEDHVLREYSSATDITISSYKYGVLHLFSGFLLLLKERLSRRLPELIFKGRVNEVKQKISSGKTPNTIDLDEALERLEIGPKVIFSNDELEVIRTVQDIRNQFEHYKVSTNKYRLWTNISKFLELIDRFLVNELQINIEASSESLELQKKIHTIDSIWKRIEQQKKQKWNQDIQLKVRKFKRNHSRILQEIEQEYRVNKGAYFPFTICPDCYQETLITLGEFEGICSNSECNSINPLTECGRCGEVMTGFSWNFGFCESCSEWMDGQ
ncbi:hypothetical protein H6G96_20150 [Nostoc sp. FACHB-892]|uniref:hypothetical protein n=1 Tax=Nostoc sp. FACHB-892 TaxID=2692843 RepID=UPI001684181C|nr:hypothetical protein [Nostoc sp. FACHB-892]MBD2728566.1 hypothetical protein [Nostoc sp. FACHB-892]